MEPLEILLSIIALSGVASWINSIILNANVRSIEVNLEYIVEALEKKHGEAK